MGITFRGNPLDQFEDEDDLDNGADEDWTTPHNESFGEEVVRVVLTTMGGIIFEPVESEGEELVEEEWYDDEDHSDDNYNPDEDENEDDLFQEPLDFDDSDSGSEIDYVTYDDIDGEPSTSSSVVTTDKPNPDPTDTPEGNSNAEAD